MALLNLTTDYLVIDGLETIKYTAKRSGSRPVAVDVNAKRLKLSKTARAYTAGIQLTGDELLWRLSVLDLSGAGIPDCQIQDSFSDSDGVLWSVLSASFQKMTQSWWCVCRAQPPIGGP